MNWPFRAFWTVYGVTVAALLLWCIYGAVTGVIGMAAEARSLWFVVAVIAFFGLQQVERLDKALRETRAEVDALKVEVLNQRRR